MLGRDKIEKLIDLAQEKIDEDSGGEASVGVAILVLEVRPFDGDASFWTFSSDKRQWVQEAALKEAQEAVVWNDEDDD